ncbi:hypothetical protein Tco_1393979 [Tanacetum coccineum]
MYKEEGDSKTKSILNLRSKELDKSEEPKGFGYYGDDAVIPAVMLAAGVYDLAEMLKTQLQLWGVSPSDMETPLDKMRCLISLHPKTLTHGLKDAIRNLSILYVKPVRMHAVPPPIIGTFMPPSSKPDIDDTQFTYGSKSNNYSESNSVSNNFVSCETSDKPAYVPADSRNRPTSVPAGRPFPAVGKFSCKSL